MGIANVLGKMLKSSAKELKRNTYNKIAGPTYRDGLLTYTFYDENGYALSKRQLDKLDRQAREARLESERQQAACRDALKERGVPVDLLTKKATAEDAFDIANRYCKARIPETLKPERSLIIWSDLTKTGKLPKCVAESTVVWDFESGHNVVAHVKYLADIEPYSSDIYIYTDGGRFDYKLRIVDGELKLVVDGVQPLDQ